MKLSIIVLTIVAIFGCNSNKLVSSVYQKENLIIEKIAKNTFVHTSFLETERFGKVPCNGMIIINEREAIVFDTPANNAASTALISWIQEEQKSHLKAVVVSHFHVDCLGGLNEFHSKKIPSFANNLTIKLAKAEEATIPQNGFDNYLELKIGNKKVVNEFFGEGHTKDNIISYFPSDKTLFGGCLVKSKGAGKGNLNDANVLEWSNTVKKLKLKYGNANVVIPGHGKSGGIELLDYTIELFNSKIN